MNTPLTIMDLMVGSGIIDTITHLVAQDMLIETPNCNLGLSINPMNHVFEAKLIMTLNLWVGLDTTTYIVEPQTNHQCMPIHEIETQSTQHALDFNHKLISKYLLCQTHFQPQVGLRLAMVVVSMNLLYLFI